MINRKQAIEEFLMYVTIVQASKHMGFRETLRVARPIRSEVINKYDIKANQARELYSFCRGRKKYAPMCDDMCEDFVQLSSYDKMKNINFFKQKYINIMNEYDLSQKEMNYHWITYQFRQLEEGKKNE